MGTFVNFTGDMSVPEEEMELFNRYMPVSYTHLWSGVSV